MVVRSDVLGRVLTPAEEKEADTNKDGTVSKEELKAFEDQQYDDVVNRARYPLVKPAGGKPLPAGGDPVPEKNDPTPGNVMVDVPSGTVDEYGRPGEVLKMDSDNGNVFDYSDPANPVYVGVFKYQGGTGYIDRKDGYRGKYRHS